VYPTGEPLFVMMVCPTVVVAAASSTRGFPSGDGDISAEEQHGAATAGIAELYATVVRGVSDLR